MPAFRDFASPCRSLIKSLVNDHGWVGQPWLGFARVAIKIDANGVIGCVSPEGRDSINALDAETRAMIRTALTPKTRSNVYFALRGRRPGEKIWIMDCLRAEGRDLTFASFAERWEEIPKNFISPKLKLAAPLRTDHACWEATAVGKVLMRNPNAWGWFPSSSLILRSRDRSP